MSVHAHSTVLKQLTFRLSRSRSKLFCHAQESWRSLHLPLSQTLCFNNHLGEAGSARGGRRVEAGCRAHLEGQGRHEKVLVAQESTKDGTTSTFEVVAGGR